MTQPQNVIAVVYDYDRTLSPVIMQNDVIFPAIGVEGDEFWSKANGLREERAYEDELAWLRLLLENADIRKLSNRELEKLGHGLTFHPGVPQVFAELSGFLSEEKYHRHGVTLEHYIVTSGLKAVLEGSALSDHVEAIFGCELDEDEAGRVFWPKRVVSHTAKTQYLFRISKGPEYVDLSHDVNDHMPEEERRIPFKNMVYIGDGPTDVPCFAVITSRGGVALAVYDPHDDESLHICQRLLDAKRVREIGPANYGKGSHLRSILEYRLKRIANRIVNELEQAHQRGIIPAARPR